MRTVVVAGIGGVVLGHVIWLLAVTAATSAHTLSTGVLAVSGLLLVAGGLAISRGRQAYQRGRWTRAAFLGGLAVSPVLLSIVVLAELYL